MGWLDNAIKSCTKEGIRDREIKESLVPISKAYGKNRYDSFVIPRNKWVKRFLPSVL